MRTAPRTLDPHVLQQLLQEYGLPVDIIGPVLTPDGAGGWVAGTPVTKLSQVLAVVGHPVAGGAPHTGGFQGEQLVAGQLQAMGTREVLMAYDASISVKDQIIKPGNPRPLEILTVNDPLDTHELLLLSCYEIQL